MDELKRMDCFEKEGFEKCRQETKGNHKLQE